MEVVRSKLEAAVGSVVRVAQQHPIEIRIVTACALGVVALRQNPEAFCSSVKNLTNGIVSVGSVLPFDGTGESAFLKGLAGVCPQLVEKTSLLFAKVVYGALLSVPVIVVKQAFDFFCLPSPAPAAGPLVDGEKDRHTTHRIKGPGGRQRLAFSTNRKK